MHCICGVCVPMLPIVGAAIVARRVVCFSISFYIYPFYHQNKTLVSSSNQPQFCRCLLIQAQIEIVRIRIKCTHIQSQLHWAWAMHSEWSGAISLSRCYGCDEYQAIHWDLIAHTLFTHTHTQRHTITNPSIHRRRAQTQTQVLYSLKAWLTYISCNIYIHKCSTTFYSLSIWKNKMLTLHWRRYVMGCVTKIAYHVNVWKQQNFMANDLDFKRLLFVLLLRLSNILVKSKHIAWAVH